MGAPTAAHLSTAHAVWAATASGSTSSVTSGKRSTTLAQPPALDVSISSVMSATMADRGTSRAGSVTRVDHVRWDDRPRLRRPVLIAAFEGWNDAGDGATMAARWLAATWEARSFGTIDPEEFYDFSTTRPRVRLTDGITR
ncbi:MAG: PAC2 family protein, partial [Acidimicrobiales bacterium]